MPSADASNLPPQSVESLEARALLSTVTLDNNRLIIIGDQHKSNTITVRYTKDADDVIANVNGKVYAFDANDVDDIRIFGGDRHDVIKVLQTSPDDNPFDKSVTLRGGAGDDLLVGQTESDLITGDGGNDTIIGGAEDDTVRGHDTIFGGTGNDRITVDTDSVLVFGGRGNDVVTGLARRGYVWGNEGDDTLNMPGDHLILLGNAGNDTITGAGQDSLYGGGGADVLSGGRQRTLGEISHVNQLAAAFQLRIPTLADPSR